MAYAEELAERVRAAFGARAFTERKMFGGIAFMVSGNMCCGVVGGRLVVRVGPEAFEDALAQVHAAPMDFTGRPLKGMVYVEPPGLDSSSELRGWVERGFAFAGSLPPK